MRKKAAGSGSTAAKPRRGKRAAKRPTAGEAAAPKRRAGEVAAAEGKPPAEGATAERRRTAAEQLPSRRARLARPRELWGRRTVAVGVVLVAAAILGGILLLLLGSDDDNGSSGPSPQDIAKLQNQVLKKTVVDPRAGISVRRPSSWSDDVHGNVIALRSKSRCVAMTLAAPTHASQWRKLANATIDALRGTQKGIAFRRAGNAPVGGIPTASYRAAFKNEKGDEIRAVVSVGKGKRYAYLTETVLGNTKCKGDLDAAQLIVTSIEYTK